MLNPFEIIDRRLSAIEDVLQELRIRYQSSPSYDTDPYGDFKWLTATCQGVPASTLRIKSAAGEIPGVVKFGKRVLYDKKIVLNWLKSQIRRPTPNADQLEQKSEEQINCQLDKKGGKNA